MQVALLLAACFAPAPAAPDWVEISQHHYRKPVRGHAEPGVQDGPTYYPTEGEETRPTDNYPAQDVRRSPNLPVQNPVHPAPNFATDETLRLVHNVPKGIRRIYLNHSISEHTWNQNIYQVLGNVRRDDNFKIKANVTPQFGLETYEPVIEDTPELYKQKEQESVSATIERVPNKGSVKRVQLSNTPVKSPTVPNAAKPIRRNDVRKYGPTTQDAEYSDEFEIKSDVFNNVEKEVVAVSHINEVKHVFGSNKAIPVRNFDGIITSTVWPTNEISMPFHKYLQSQYTRKPDNQRENNIGKDKIKSSNMKNDSTVEDNCVSDAITKPKDIQSKPSQSIHAIEEKITSIIANNDKNNEAHVESEEVAIGNDIKNNSNQFNRPPDANVKLTTRPNDDTNSSDDKKANEEIKVNTMEKVVKFMKVVADTISKNTKKGVNGKVKYLNELKDTLLSSLKERIDVTWPDDASLPTRRHSRAASERGHVEFPSSESSLMTISFLTFAVFLIKLVLQVIQTYKNKAMMVAPLVVATAGRSVTVRKLRTLH